jgi:DNA-binding PadR family transcriptional regulator
VKIAPHLPLKPLEFALLAALSDGERHPYALKKHLERSDAWGRPIGAGTLYRVIGQLLDAGLIEDSPRRPDPDLDDPRRTYYRLTAAGRRAARAEARRLTALVASTRVRQLAAGQS